jgi:hypothetical protein
MRNCSSHKNRIGATRSLLSRPNAQNSKTVSQSRATHHRGAGLSSLERTTNMIAVLQAPSAHVVVRGAREVRLLIVADEATKLKSDWWQKRSVGSLRRTRAIWAARCNGSVVDSGAGGSPLTVQIPRVPSPSGCVSRQLVLELPRLELGICGWQSARHGV